MHAGSQDFGTVRQMPRQLVLSEAGLEHIKLFEGLRARTYDDFAPNRRLENAAERVRGTLTIGYGHTGRHAWVGNEITTEQADAILAEDVLEVENYLKSLVRVPLSQGEFDALVGFIFNVGPTNFSTSTMRRRLNVLDFDGAAMEFERWVYSKGRKLKGLKMRRIAERAIFTGAASFGLIDLGALAGRAEEMLEIGSNVRPDAIEGAGVMKPKRKSKTMWTAGSGLVASAIGYMADLDQTVQFLLIALAFSYLIFNRWLEWKAGEH